MQIDPIQSYLKGHFLIAMPGLADPNFFRSVSVICEHTTEGAMGIIVDRMIPDLSSETIFSELGVSFLPECAHYPIFFGGPVHTTELFIIHGPPFGFAGCLQVTSWLALSNTIDVLKDIAKGRGPSDFLISLGCSGWGGGQLEAELKSNAWLSSPACPDIAFTLPAGDKWTAAIRQMGIDPDLLTSQAGHA